MTVVAQASRRRQKSVASQEEILEHAIELFGNFGLDGVSLRSISEASGISLGSIYYYFPEKEALYDAAVARAMDQRSEEVRKRLILGATQEESVKNFFTAMSTFVRGASPGRALVRRAHLEATNPQGSGPMRAYAVRAVGWHRAEIKEFMIGLAPRCPHPARLLIRLYYLAWGAAIMEPLTCAEGDELAYERVSRDLVESGLMLVRGMSKPADSPVEERLRAALAAAEAVVENLSAVSGMLAPAAVPLEST